MIQNLLVANRGEIARRIFRTARRMGMATVAIHGDADAGAAHVDEADRAVRIEAAAPAQAYLHPAGIIAAALASGAQAIHPGYGFLSENADFAQAVIAAGLIWVGPDPDTIRLLGDKAAARERMGALGFPVGLGGEVADAAAALALGRKLGAPVIVKACSGGGGIGMQVVHDLDALPAAIERVNAQARRFFGGGGILVERYLAHARHIELQVVGAPDGSVRVIGERDCSVQRRFQKVIEEAPAARLSPRLRERMYRAAGEALAGLGYRNLGTVECLVDGEAFVFLEVNTRLQVEHPVTEMITGLDLVELQLRIAAGLDPGLAPGAAPPQGHAMELRVYAEDPVRFLPGGGRITQWREPTGPGIRVDAGYREGDEVTAYFDPLMAKLCVHGPDRQAVITRAREAVAQFAIAGPKNNLPFLARVLEEPDFVADRHDTGLVAQMQQRAVPA